MLVCSVAPAVSELTSIAFISVTGVCLRQKDAEQQQMRARKTEGDKNNHFLERMRRTMWRHFPWDLSFFQPIVIPFHRELSLLFYSDVNCYVSVKRATQRETEDILTQIH